METPFGIKIYLPQVSCPAGIKIHLEPLTWKILDSCSLLCSRWIDPRRMLGGKNEMDGYLLRNICPHRHKLLWRVDRDFYFERKCRYLCLLFIPLELYHYLWEHASFIYV